MVPPAGRAAAGIGRRLEGGSATNRSIKGAETQENAWRLWTERERLRFAGPVRDLLRQVPADAEHAPWIQAARRPLAPVAAVMAEWLLPPEAGTWLVVPGVVFSGLRLSGGALLSYPEALEDDPLALAGLALVAWEIGALPACGVARRLSVGLVAVAQAVGIAGVRAEPGFEEALAGFRGWHAAAGKPDWAASPAALAGPGPSGSNPVADDVQVARELLLLGLPPHRPPGQRLLNPGAVLLALATVERPPGGGLEALAAKGVEGAVLSARWEEALHDGG